MNTIPTLNKLLWHDDTGTKSEDVSRVVGGGGAVIWATDNRIAIKRQASEAAWNPDLFHTLSSWASYFSEP